jgi:uncharacterized membrane protein
MIHRKKDILIPWFGALCFFLSAIEYMIPKPLPFLRLGLANIPVMLAIDLLPLPSYFALIAIKILGQGLIGGTLFSYVFVFSAAGTLASALTMLALKRAFGNRVSWTGVSVTGAFASNALQLFLARWYVFGESAWYIAPPFLTAGLITGTALGMFTNRFASTSRWYAEALGGTLLPLERAAAGPESPKPSIWDSGPLRGALGIPLLWALLFSPSTALKGTCAALAIILVLLDGGRIRLVPTLSVTGGIILANLLVPFGKVLWSPFGLPLTQGALLAGIEKALALEGMLFISKWMITDRFRIPGRLGAQITESFRIFRRLAGYKGRLAGGKGRLSPGSLVASLDDILLGLRREPD